MSQPTNPYITTNSVNDSPVFVGRANILHEVMQMLHSTKDKAIVLYGQRCIGKTSALQYLTAQLSAKNYYPIYFDLTDKATLPLVEVLCELAQAIAQTINTINKIDSHLGEHPETTFIDTWLPNVLHSLPEKTTLVLLFDEFDVLSEPKSEQAGGAFFPYLRQLLDRKDNLKFVFASGRNVDDLDNLAVSLFKGIPPIQRISLLNKKDTTKLVRLSEANQSLNWADEAVNCVWRYTQGHPFLTQQVCFQVWEQANEDPKKSVATATLAEVENVIFDVLDVNRNSLEWLWDGLPPALRVAASALAEAGPEHITEQGLEKWLSDNGVQVIIRELQNAPRLLQDWDLLEYAEDGYCFRVELVRRWIRENKPLRRVQDELDCIDPVAESLYQRALALYKEEKLNTSANKLRETIALNPNHLKAHQLLADILLSKGKTISAKILLEKLSVYKPLAARSRLIQALLTLVEESKDEEQQLKWCEQVLKLEPTQPEATAKRKNILQKQAKTALATEDFNTAISVYQKLGFKKKLSEIELKIRTSYFELKKDFFQLKKQKRYQISILSILLVFFFGVGVYWTPQVEQSTSSESIFLQQINDKNPVLLENSLLEKELEQSHQNNMLLEKELEQVYQHNMQLETKFEQSQQQINQFQKQIWQLSQTTELGKFLLKLEKGDQVVIIGTFRKQQDAEKYVEQIKQKYPEMFYPQVNLMPESVKDHIYKRGLSWEVFISGFYSYKAARKLRNRILKLDLIKGAFIRKDPFRNQRLLPISR